LLQRRFEEAIEVFLHAQEREEASDAISSALAAAYHRLGFQTLADQVRRSVRSCAATNGCFAWAIDRPALRIRPEFLQRGGEDGAYPIIRERTPVRMT